MRKSTTYTESQIRNALMHALRAQRHDPDPTTARFAMGEDGKITLTVDVGVMRWAVTCFIDNKRTVVGWGDTEAEAMAHARQHPRVTGHSQRWSISESAFDKIAAGDFDASGWAP